MDFYLRVKIYQKNANICNRLFSIKNAKISNEFIRWFHEFSVTTNLRMFCEVEFVYLFLFTVNVNNNIHFR